MTAELSGPLCYAISEYVSRHDGEIRTEYQVEDGPTVIARGIADQALAEDIAALPILKRELKRLSGLVPVRRSEDNRLESVCQLLEELLAEVKRGNAVERTGSVSSAHIESNSKGINCSVKCYAGSEVPVDEALEAYGRLVRDANERAMNGWANTVEALKV